MVHSCLSFMYDGVPNFLGKCFFNNLILCREVQNRTFRTYTVSQHLYTLPFLKTCNIFFEWGDGTCFFNLSSTNDFLKTPFFYRKGTADGKSTIYDLPSFRCFFWRWLLLLKQNKIHSYKLSCAVFYLSTFFYPYAASVVSTRHSRVRGSRLSLDSCGDMVCRIVRIDNKFLPVFCHISFCKL